MSVSPNGPRNLPSHRRPPTLGGTGKDPVWRITIADLGIDLQYRPDPARAGHGFVEPVRLMTLSEYQQGFGKYPTLLAEDLIEVTRRDYRP